MTDIEATTRPPYVTIGEFGRRSGLSLKALRLYDARGLLPPASVDPTTGYRSYALDQLGRAHTIALLRRLDMPLDTVGDLLARPPAEVTAAVREWWEQRRRDLVDKGPELDLVLERLGAPDASAGPGAGFDPADVVVRHEPARTIATIRRHVTQPDLVATFCADALTIRRHLDSCGASYGTEHWVLFHGAVGSDGDGPVETCVPYTGSSAPRGEVVLREEPAQALASIPVTAPDCRFPQIIGAYTALERWFTQTGHQPSGCSREVYPVPWSDNGVVAHIARPLGTVAGPA